jgi:hypothetical protein
LAYCLEYVFVNWFLVFVTLKVPSWRAETLIQYAEPSWTGGGGAGAPAAGAGIAATGIEDCGTSRRLAINIPGTVYS